MAIRFIYFDLDDTLLDHAAAELAALQDLYRTHREHMDGRSFGEVHAHYRRINPEVWRSYSDGEIDKEEARTRRFRLLGDAVPITDEDVVRMLPDAYLDRYACHWTPLPGALEAFEHLSTRIPVGILTNGFAEIQQAKFRRFPELERRASAVVISETVGYMKPDSRIFDHAAKLAGVAPGEILYVGDSLRSDVKGGRDAGWNVAWYRPPDRSPDAAAAAAAAAATENDLPEHLPDDLPDDLPAGTFVFSNWRRLIGYASSLFG